MNKEVKKRALELYASGMTNKSAMARIISEELSLEYNAVRHATSRCILKVEAKKHDPALIAECERVGIDPSKVDAYWHKSKHFSLKVKGDSNEATSIDFDRIISECFNDKTMVRKVPNKYTDKTFDRLVWTDVHVGMDASRNGLALYPVDWGSESLMSRINEMIEFVVINKSSDTLVIDELGDYMDGWDGETTRKGHKLPQNMTNEEAFDVGLKAKIFLIDSLSKVYKHILCNNICEDNHAGAFGYVVNSAFKQVVDHKYNNVEVVNHQKFINHYIIGSHAFIITHGKDSRNLKFGFKPILDPRTSEKISQYIRHNSDLRFVENMEFSKGDSHQCLFDMCTSDEFDYFNYPAFSPSSEWVQTNFKKGRSGFVMQNISMHTSQKITKTYFFN
jgi:hypothetical protein